MFKRFTKIIALSMSLFLLSSCANKKEEMNKIVTDNSNSRPLLKGMQ